MTLVGAEFHGAQMVQMYWTLLSVSIKDSVVLHSHTEVAATLCAHNVV
jgi:hypothetical protein